VVRNWVVYLIKAVGWLNSDLNKAFIMRSNYTAVHMVWIGSFLSRSFTQNSNCHVTTQFRTTSSSPWYSIKPSHPLQYLSYKFSKEVVGGKRDSRSDTRRPLEKQHKSGDRRSNVGTSMSIKETTASTGIATIIVMKMDEVASASAARRPTATARSPRM